MLYFVNTASSQAWTTASPAPLLRHSSAAVLLQDGRVMKTGGWMAGGACFGYTAGCEIFDPATNQWTTVAPMAFNRGQHTATMLYSGEILVTGGFCGGASAEKYNPITNTWTTVAPMNVSRFRHTATLLNDGRVLVIGSDGGVWGNTCEIYDPVLNTWTLKTPMSLPRNWHVSVLLPNGKVFVTGGMQFGAGAPRTEIYDPVLNTWTIAAADPLARVCPSATLLPNGRILVTGGSIPGSIVTQAPCAIYNPSANTWAVTGALNFARDQFSQVLLPDGRILAIGGDAMNSCEIYNPAVGTWTVTAPITNTANQLSTVLLADGRVLNVCGYTTPEAQIFDYKTGTWAITGNLVNARNEYTLTSLATGRILIAGGAPILPMAGAAMTSCELYNPATTTWALTGSMITPRAYHASVLLPDGRVLTTGGATGALSGITGTATPNCEIFDPATGAWTATGAMNYARTSHQVTLLFNGKVLVTGGLFPIPAELYDPATGIWTEVATPVGTYFQHTATLLPDGKVLIAKAGLSALFNPCTEEFEPTGVLSAAAGRFKAQAHLLHNNKVIYIGGAVGGAATANCYLYDYLTGIWTVTGSMITPRTSFGSTVLPSGEVVVNSGYNAAMVTTAEKYNPISGTWSATGIVPNPRTRHLSVLLPDGDVLVAGGNDFVTMFNTTAEYDQGQGYAAGAVPVITTLVPASIVVPSSTAGYTTLSLTGTGFQDNNTRRGSQASCGVDRTSATDYPLVQVSRIGGNRYDNDFTRYLPFDVAPGNTWDSTKTIVRFPYGVPNQLPPGVYAVRVIANGIPSEPAYLKVAVSCNVIADFAADVVCLGDSTTFTDLSTGTPANCWLWYFGDGDSSLVQNPKHLYTAAGTYNVTLIVHSEMGCTDSITQTVTVLDHSIANVVQTDCDSALINGNWYFASQMVNDTLFGAAVNGCDSIVNTNLTINYTITNNVVQTNCDSALINGNWYFVSQLVNDVLVGAASTGCDSIVNTTLTINYSVTVNQNVVACDSAQINGTWYFVSQIVTDVFAGGAANGCDSTLITNLTINGSAMTVVNVVVCSGDNYVYPDGTVSAGIIVPESQVSTLVTSLGCDSLVTTNVGVNPEYVLVQNVNVCDGNAIVYPDGFVEVITANTSHVSNLFTTAGCDSTITTNVTMDPVYAIVQNINACDGDPVVYPDGSVAIITSSTSYVSSLLTMAGCDSLITTNVTMDPVYNIVQNATICSGDDYTFNDGTTHFGIVADESYTSSYLTVAGCDSLIVENITVNPLPSVNAGPDKTVCAGLPVTLSGSGALVYVWTGGVTDGVAFVPVTSGPYTVSGTDANGCVNTDIVNVTVSPLPVVLFSGDSLQGCEPLPVNFDNLSAPAGFDCLWDFGDGTTTSGCGTVSHTYDFAGTYDVTLTVVTVDGCTASATINSYINVYDQPKAGFMAGQPTVDEFDMEVEFYNSSIDATSYLWIWHDSSPNSNEEEPTHLFNFYPTTGYNVEMIAYNGTCTDTAWLYIPLDDVLIYFIPNAFTPDGNGANESFKPIFTSGFDPWDYHLMIFNRWGELIFESFNAAYGWPGTYGDVGLVEDGVYIWKIDFKDSKSDKRYVQEGHVVLMK